MKRGLILFLLLFLGIFFLVPRVFALEVAWPRSPMGTVLTDSSSLTDVVKYFYEWGLFLGGVAAFISIIFGGILYLTSAGDPGRLREAKDRIFSAIIGLVLLLSVYLIFNTINPELTALRVPSFGPPTTTLAGIGGYGPGNCTSSLIYELENFGGNSVELTPDVCVGPIPLSAVKSVDVNEGCRVRLYHEQADCNSPKFLEIGWDEKNVDKYGFGTVFTSAMIYTGCPQYTNQTDCQNAGCGWCAGDCVAGSDCVAVAYEDVDYKGARLIIRGDVPDIGASWNDRMSSIRVNPGVTLVLYEHTNFATSGASTTIAADTPNFCGFAGPHGGCGNCSIFLCNIVTGPFIDNWNDCVSSIDVL